jgi:hypothetical protein
MHPVVPYQHGKDSQMAGKAGTIWAQSLFWNSTHSSKSCQVVLAERRNITAYSTLSGHSFLLPAQTKKAEPPVLCYGETGIAWYFTFEDGKVSRFPHEGEFDPLVPYIQADNVTQLKFRLKTALLGQNGLSSVRALHVINYFA